METLFLFVDVSPGSYGCNAYFSARLFHLKKGSPAADPKPSFRRALQRFHVAGKVVGKSVEGGEDSSAVGVGDFLKAFFSSGERMTAQEVTIVPSGLFSAVSLFLL